MMDRMPLLEKCASRITVNGTVFGDGAFGWIAGPCAVESRPQLEASAETMKRCGIGVLRGGLFKPRTSVYSFQGLQCEGIALVAEAKKKYGLAFISEVVDESSLQALLPVADILQIGSRNCLNYALLKLAGRYGRPVLLKRGFAVTMEEYLNAAEYLAASGCREILLCERGIRTVTEVTRFTLDLGGALWLKSRYPMPVIADPSHAAGDAALVSPLTLAAAAAGLDGVMLECSPSPECTRCDSRQQLTPDQLTGLKEQTDHLLKHCRGVR